MNSYNLFSLSRKHNLIPHIVSLTNTKTKLGQPNVIQLVYKNNLWLMHLYVLLFVVQA